MDECKTLLFGNERTGLENHHMRAVHATALISTGREKSSLNLSHAVGISLHEQHAALVGLGLGLDTTFTHVILQTKHGSIDDTRAVWSMYNQSDTPRE